MVKVIEYNAGKLTILDQRLLPNEEKYLECTTVEDVVYAIKELAVRGAPLIAISAAYGVCVGLHQYKDLKKLDYIFSILREARPTAYNIFLILERLEKKIKSTKSQDFYETLNIVEKEALEIHNEDKKLCIEIAKNGRTIIPPNANIITICNTGMLATGGIGTALGVIYQGFWDGKIKEVFVLETRPLLQGARLTTYELTKNNVPTTLITDNMISFLFSKHKIDLAIVGADRIVKNGDTANKIGTYTLAVVCNHFKIPFYVAAPYTTIDLNLENGKEIIIEERSPNEVRFFKNQRIANENVKVWNPAFDITPSSLITAIITDKGIFKPHEISKIKTNYPTNIS
ncbi:MAG: S-methyl-5-thioribose-1-phosphate isomerase [Brevinematia bacterium]